MSDDTATKESVALAKEEKAVIEALEKLNVVQLNNVVKFMEQEYGISAAAPVAVAGPAAEDSGDDGGAEEKSAYDVELTEAGDQKISVIKVVRAVTGLPLGEAKAAVDGAPKVIKEGIPKEEAEEIKKKIEEAGGKAILK